MHAPATRAAADRPRLRQARESVAAAAARIEGWPTWRVLATFVAVEWLAVLGLGLTARHNGWLYYQGGDQLWYYTLGWLLGHGQLWQTPVGYGWSAMLAPISWLGGPDLVSALPAIVLLNVLVLLPVAMLALYGIAARIGGRLFGYWALLLWVVVPFLGILYTNQGYHQRYTELTLPQAFGLTAMSDFPTMVATVVSLYFCARVVLSESPVLLDAVAAGVAGGFAIGIKPATTFFLVGPALAFAARRYLPFAAAFLAGMLPAILTLAVWKERGLGYLPAVGHIAARPFVGMAVGAPLVGLGIDQYFRTLTWSHLLNNVDLLREHFWSGRVAVWLFLAGLIGLLRRSPRALLLIGGAIVPFTLAKGSYTGASVEDASVFRLLMPCFPAFILLLACLPLLLPHAPARLRTYEPARTLLRPRARIAALAAAVLMTAVVPLAAFAATDTSRGGHTAAYAMKTQMPIPVDIDLGATATVRGGHVLLAWKAQHPPGGRVFYRVWRLRRRPGLGLDCPPVSGAPLCKLDSTELGTTAGHSFTDAPGSGQWVYRIAVAANWLDDPAYGDAYFVSTPLPVRTP